MDIGNYQGFNMRIQFDGWSKEFILSVKHEAVSKVHLGADALGNITRINNLLDSYPEKLSEAQQRLETVYEQMANAKEEVGKPFPKEEELNQKLERLSELNALLNMDLSQAEAVADLIASSSAATHRLAMSQMRGGFSKELTDLRNKLLNFTSMIELELDFSEEDVEFADRSALRKLADEIEQVISRLAHSFSVGNAIKNGVPVAIIGETNAGKSTLLNVLLNEDKAIVSDIHGTTRDVIEDTVNIGGITFRFIDTAGIRETNDTIESLGIERTFQKLDQAEIVLWMVDAVNAASQIEQLSEKIIPRCEGKHLIVVFNKADLIEGKQKEDLLSLLKDFPKESTESIFISAKQRENTSELQKMLIDAAHLPTVTQNDIIVTNVRHYEALNKALEAIHRVQNGLDSQISGDFLSQDIRECIFFISDIAGEVTNDMVIQNIFQHFCIGK